MHAPPSVLVAAFESWNRNCYTSKPTANWGLDMIRAEIYFTIVVVVIVVLVDVAAIYLYLRAKP